jgi:5-formyltetrahydrofolate cyclo-ligase
MQPEDIQAAKARARRIVAEAVLRLTPSQRRAASVAVAQRVMNLPSVRAARTLMTYLALPTEIDTWPIIRWAWGQGKRVCVPRIEPAPDGRPAPLWERPMVVVALEPAEVDGVAAHPAVRPGALGILEVPGAPPVDVAQIDVLLMPCQAVDRAGRRLGKGGGFFDRLLARPDLRASRIVLAFHEQVLDEVPVDADDLPVDMGVTDTGVLAFGPPSAKQ